MSAEHKDPLKAYLVVFFTLMLLLVLTVLAYMIPFEDWTLPGTSINLSFMNTVIALTIASIKATLVVLVFMHLRYSSKLTWIIAVAGFLWLGIMMAFTFTDYLSRAAIPEAMKTPMPAVYAPADMKTP